MWRLIIAGIVTAMVLALLLACTDPSVPYEDDW